MKKQLKMELLKSKWKVEYSICWIFQKVQKVVLTLIIKFIIKYSFMSYIQEILTWIIKVFYHVFLPTTYSHKN